MSQLRVGVLCGGFSNEREVSLRTGRAVNEALKLLGHIPIYIDVKPSLITDIESAQVDICYNALHGTFGEDGQLQSILDFLRMPYTGENQRTSVVAFDKKLSKLVYESAKVSTPKWVVFQQDTTIESISDTLGYPLFAKPISEGSSVGVEKITSAQSLASRRSAWKDTPYLLEAAVLGTELSVACWGGQVLGSVEIEPKREFYDYEAKYGQADTQYFIPPRIADEQRQEAERVALAAHQALGCRSLCRTDVMVNETGAYVLETNTLPGMTETSLVPKIAAAQGISFANLIAKVVDQAWSQQQDSEAT